MAFRGVEVLARWHHPERGVVPPNAFLPVAESLSVIDQIDRMILHKALTECSDLHDSGIELHKVSFNVSQSRVASEELITDLRDASGLPFTLAIELLESIYIEEEGDDFMFTLDLFQELGLRIEVDDFGSGRASVVALTRINPDAIKIDQRLVAPIEHREDARAMLKALVDIGHALNIDVLAEGVETPGQIRLLREMGCQALQGFFFAKPLPISGLVSFLADETDRFKLAVNS